MTQGVSLRDWCHLWRVLTATGAFGPHPAKGVSQLLRVVARHGPTPYALVAWHALRQPGVTAIVAQDGTRTYREVQQAADVLAGELRQVIRPGDRVGLLGRGGCRWLVGLLAATRLGADVVLLNTLHGPAEWAEQVQRLTLKAILHEPAFFEGLRSWPHAAALVDVNRPPARRASAPLRPGCGAVTLLTSGSTGTPRAIQRKTGLNRAQAALTATDFLSRLSIRSGERVWLPPPLFHGQGLSALMLTLGFGGTLVLGPEPRPGALRDSLERTSPHWVILVPTALHRLLEGVTEPLDLPHLRGVVSGSAPLSPALAERARQAFQGRLFNLYGTTETGPISLATPADFQHHADTVGRVLKGAEVELAGGTVTVRSPFLAVPEACWDTGDLAAWHGPGHLRLLGRADDRFICGGENVDPLALGRIEALPGVAECAVWGAADAEYGQVVQALVVPATPDLDVQALRCSLEEALPRTFRPRVITLCPELPRNAAGKLVRRHLPDWHERFSTLR